MHGGIGLVKLMGRHAGFITAGATVASQDVNFALIPEVPFKLETFLAALKQRMLEKIARCDRRRGRRGTGTARRGRDERDASGNVKLQDIGPFLREKIKRTSKPKASRSSALFRSQLPDPQPPRQQRGRPALRSVRAPRRARRDGGQDRRRHRFSARALHSRADRTARHAHQTSRPASGWWRSVLAATGQSAEFD